MELTQARLKELLHYDPETGHFTWTTHRRCCKPGRRAGYTRHDGYVCIRVDGVLYLAHRLAWLWMTGEWPANDLDHINVNSNDNRWCNLRKCTRAENTRNTKRRADNKSGYKGVFWNTQKQKWQARIQVGGKAKHLGFFATPQLAHDAYRAVANDVHGEFARVS